MAQSFIFGGNTGMSYDQIQKKREIANELLRANMYTPQNVGEGLAAIGRALAAKAIDKRTGKAEAEGRRMYEQEQDNTFSMLGGGSATPASAPAQPPVTFDPNSPQGVASDAMAALGKAVYTPGDRDSFVAAMMPHALRVSEMTGLDPRLVIAQAAQETGWGKSSPNNNYFGIKSHGKDGGANLGTFEFVDGQRVNVNDSFRTYGGMGESADDYARFLMENPRYKEMLSAGDLQSQIDALGRSGYATDPNYAASVSSIANSIQVPGLQPSGGQPAPAGQPAQGGPMANPAVLMALADIQGNPYASESDKAIAALLMDQTVQAMDPMRQMEMEKARLELDAMRNPQPGFRTLTDDQEATMGLDTAGLYQMDKDGKIYTVQEPKAPAEDPTSVREYNFYVQQEQAAGRPVKSYGDWKTANAKAGATSVTVGGENSGAFNKKTDEAAAARFDGYVQAGANANRMMGDINALVALAPQIGTGKEAEVMATLGPYAEALGFDVQGLGEAQAFQSIVDRMAPAMRPAGSGASSDFDAKQFLSSLPQLGRTPEGNQIIIQTMTALQQHQIAAADIASRAMLPPDDPNFMQWQEAEKQIRALGDPYTTFNEYKKSLPKEAADPATDEGIPTYNAETGMWE